MNTWKKMLGGIILGAGLLAAQGPVFPTEPGLGLVPPGQGRYAELKSWLNLTDAQLQQLEQIQAQRSREEQAIYDQITQKQTTLYGLLSNGSQDVAQIGQLMVDINTLQRKLPVSSGPYRTQALAVLNDEQKAKLPPLDQAIRLNSTAYQGVSLNLVNPPEYQNPGIVPLRAISLPAGGKQ